MFKIFITSFVLIIFITLVSTELGLYGDDLIELNFNVEESLGIDDRSILPTDSDAGFGIGPLINAIGVVVNTFAEFFFGALAILITIVQFVANVAQLAGLRVDGIPSIMNYLIILPLNFAFVGSLVMLIRGNS